MAAGTNRLPAPEFFAEKGDSRPLKPDSAIVSDLPPRLTDEAHERLRSLHNNRWTEQAYCHRATRFIFSRNEIPISDGRGAKDPVTMLAVSLKAPLHYHLKKVKAINERNLAQGWGHVRTPTAHDPKYPKALGQWHWRWIFLALHSPATHLLEGGYDIRTVRKLLDHNDVKTTMIYSHLLIRGPAGVRSPIDGL